MTPWLDGSRRNNEPHKRTGISLLIIPDSNAKLKQWNICACRSKHTFLPTTCIYECQLQYATAARLRGRLEARFDESGGLEVARLSLPHQAPPCFVHEAHPLRIIRHVHEHTNCSYTPCDGVFRSI